MIVFDSVSKQYPDNEGFAINDASFCVPTGQTLALIGGSGCGKSTLLKMANRLITPTQGRILIDGEDAMAMDVRALRQRIGYVAQMPTLFPHMTLGDNIALPLRIAQWPNDKKAQRVAEMMQLTGLADIGPGRYPDEMSGGQQQRACLARALVTSPSFLLLDEPFAALDAITRHQMQQEVKSIREQMRVTILLVTHDILEALYLGDIIAVIHDGRVEQSGPGDTLLNHPATPYVRSLMANPYVKQAGHGA